MIVDPDFADHWKTRLLVGLLEGDEAAPIYVIRLWAHCQNRRQDKFDNLTPEALKALCRFPGHANKLESSLVASGFIRRNENSIEVVNWAEYNASLLAAWKNGSKGGRPKQPADTPAGEPTDKPMGSREEKRREEKIKHSLSHHGKIEIPLEWDTQEFHQAVVLWKQDWFDKNGQALGESKLTLQLMELRRIAEGWPVDKVIRSIQKAIAVDAKRFFDPDEQRPSFTKPESRRRSSAITPLPE